MSVRIRCNDCAGCGRCADICPVRLIRINEEGKAYIPHFRDCWGCTACVKACPAGAIDFYLGHDLEGNRATLTVQKTTEGYVWLFSGHHRRIGKKNHVNAKAASAVSQ